MPWQPDPLLLELFESVYKDLSRALEAHQRMSDMKADQPVSFVSARIERIASLRQAMAALEAALECRHNRIVH
jgi:hypothetical protein